MNAENQANEERIKAEEAVQLAKKEKERADKAEN